MASVPRGARAIGSNLYLFSTTQSASECLISAHGGYDKENVTFKVPAGVTIHFYAPHKHVLQDPGVKMMAQDLSSFAVETCKPGQDCVNYTLTKYQGRHNTAGETYDSIESTIRDFERRFLETQDKMAKMGDVDKLTKGQLARYQMLGGSLANLKALNVATIRNRWYHAGVTLKYVVAEVTKAAKGISVFHCSFCRSLNSDDHPLMWKVGSGVV